MTLCKITKSDYFERKYGRKFTGKSALVKEVLDDFIESGEAVSEIKGIEECFSYAEAARNAFCSVINKCGMSVKVSVIKEKVYLLNPDLFDDAELSMLDGPGRRKRRGDLNGDTQV